MYIDHFLCEKSTLKVAYLVSGKLKRHYKNIFLCRNFSINLFSHTPPSPRLPKPCLPPPPSKTPPSPPTTHSPFLPPTKTPPSSRIPKPSLPPPLYPATQYNIEGQEEKMEIAGICNNISPILSLIKFVYIKAFVEWID